MEGPFRLVNDVLGAPSYHNGDRLGILRLTDVDEFVIANFHFFNQLSVAEGLFREIPCRTYYATAGSLGQLLHIAAADILEGEDSFFGEKRQNLVVNALLGEENVRASFSNLIGHISEELFFFLNELVHFFRLVDIDLGISLGLLDLQLRIQQCYLGASHTLRHLGVGYFLVDNYPVDQFAFLQAFSVLLHHLDQIDVRLYLAIILLSYLHDSLDSKLGETILRTEDTLGV